MTDRLTPSQRHHCMSRIRSKDTKPELKVRQWLWRHGYRYRLNVKSVPGKPDIVMRRYRTAIFVNGCFWHGHHVETRSIASLQTITNSSCCKIPQTNREFWVNKIRRNQERDQQNYQILNENGWYIITIWECQLTPSRIKDTMLHVEMLLSDNFLEIHRPKKVSYSISEDAELPMAAEKRMCLDLKKADNIGSNTDDTI